MSANVVASARSAVICSRRARQRLDVVAASAAVTIASTLGRLLAADRRPAVHRDVGGHRRRRTPLPPDATPERRSSHRRLGPADASEILTLLRAAYITGARAHRDPWLPPLTQTLDDLRAELARPAVHAWGLRERGRLVAAVRVEVDGDVARIGRLVVAPDRQGRGHGTRLLLAAERELAGPASTIELFTGQHSDANLRLYHRIGYRETHRSPAGDYELVHLAKTLTGSTPRSALDAAPAPARGVRIGEMLISSRSPAEYRAMFALTDADLARRILDCPGGASSFTAEVNAGGGDATACDPIYAEHGPDGLAARSRADTDRGHCYVRAHPEQYRWTFFAGPDEHRRTRRACGDRFAADLRAHPERYVPGRIADLPFADAAFDLALSSHLLFTYADRLDPGFHREAILELIRVTRDEVRIFPLVATGHTTTYPQLDQLLGDLRGHGVQARVVDVDYEFQAGGHQMLVCRRATATRRSR